MMSLNVSSSLRPRHIYLLYPALLHTAFSFTFSCFSFTRATPQVLSNDAGELRSLEPGSLKCYKV
jgi:hypothetical protein